MSHDGSSMLNIFSVGMELYCFPTFATAFVSHFSSTHLSSVFHFSSTYSSPTNYLLLISLLLIPLLLIASCSPRSPQEPMKTQ
jgi:hypothetical protein